MLGKLEERSIESGRSGIWTDLKIAVRGTEADYTSGPIGHAVLLLAVPMVLETLMESIFAVVDVFFVSRLGSAAVATVGLTESMMLIMETIALGLSIGITAMVARCIGERDRDGAARAAVQAIALGIGGSGDHRRIRIDVRAESAEPDGSFGRGDRRRCRLHPHHAWRQRHAAAALSDQRSVPRRRRRGDRRGSFGWATPSISSSTRC